MSNSIEIFKQNGRYEMCQIIYWPEDRRPPDYIIVLDKDGKELICHSAMGAWCEMSGPDIIMHLRIADKAMKEALVK